MRITEQSATALAAAIRTGELTSREIVEAHLELMNPALNAVVVERFTQARAEADAADAKVAAGEDLPVLHGVPFTIKESIALTGCPNTAGVVAREHIRPLADATVVRRLLEAGAIPLGLTNTSEACMWIETENRVYGRTVNAYDPTRTAGGSSGGEGAVIGSGASPFGIGTDTLGSIRIPAFCNGVFGHRPSTGLLPVTGAWPPPHGASRLCSNGPLARRAEDLMPLLRILAGPDGTDGTAIPMPLGDPADVCLPGLRVVITEDAFLPAVSRELLDARDRAAAALETRGARIVRVSMKSMRRAAEYCAGYLGEVTGMSFRAILAGEGASVLSPRELLARHGDHTVASRILAVAELVESLVPKPLARRTVAAAEALAEEVAATIGDGILLHPPLQAVAPEHGATVGRPWWVNPVAPFSLAGVPVTQVPLGLGAQGLPLGVQVAATIGNDHRTIAVAIELERAFGGWVAPASPSGQTRKSGDRVRSQRTRAVASDPSGNAERGFRSL